MTFNRINKAIDLDKIKDFYKEALVEHTYIRQWIRNKDKQLEDYFKITKPNIDPNKLKNDQ